MPAKVDMRFRNGTFLVYPDSAPENWIDILREQHVPFVVSPLHDKDEDLSELDGDLCLVSKKAHWHVAVMCDGNKPLSYFVGLSKSVNGSASAWKIENLRSMLRYFCHMDNPEKYQYPVADLRSFCGASLDALYQLDGHELTEQIIRICKYISENRITSFKGLCNSLIRHQEFDWFHIVSRQCTLFFASLLRDNSSYNKSNSKEKKSNVKDQ